MSEARLSPPTPGAAAKAQFASDHENAAGISLFCAANIAVDPSKRLSAHGIFSRVVAEKFPFAFSQPLYLIVVLRGLEDGAHTLVLPQQDGELVFDGPPIEIKVLAEDGVAILSVAILNCMVNRPGPQFLTFLVDGASLPPAFAFQLVQADV